MSNINNNIKTGHGVDRGTFISLLLMSIDNGRAFSHDTEKSCKDYDKKNSS